MKVSDRWRMMPRPLTVDFESRNDTGWDKLVTVPYAEKRNPTVRDLAVSQVFVAGVEAMTWHLWREKLGTIVLKKGDRLTYDSIVWYVQTITWELHDSRARLVCTRAA